MWVQARVQIIRDTEEIETTTDPIHQDPRDRWMRTYKPGRTEVTIRIHPAGSDETYEFRAVESARRV